MPKNGDDEKLDINKVIADDQGMDAAAHKQKSGDPALDALVDGVADIDSEPETPRTPEAPKTNVTPIDKKRKR